MNYPLFSVCMCVYKGDNASHFKDAINSILYQTVVPSEIIMVVDGPVSLEINEVLLYFETHVKIFRTIRLTTNRGHAFARQTGIENALYELIAVMDSDDIAVPDRFELQLNTFKENPSLDVLGGQISEFINNPNSVVGIRAVPLTDHDIKHYMRSRCPMNLMTVMAKKKSILSVGGYVDWFCEEDYYLWLRMLQGGCIFKNLPNVLVNVRVGKAMYARRGGWHYFKSEVKLQYYMLRRNIINVFQYIFNVVVRFIVQILLPNSVRAFLYQKIFRK